MKASYNHYYHLVSLSPWPLLTSFSVFILMMSTIMMFNYKDFFMLSLSILVTLLCSIQWWRDIIREATFQGAHTKKIIKMLKVGMFLFIISELFFFISFFWGYFHSSLSPNIEIGSSWPPLNIQQFNPYQIPLLNTIILLSSGVTITWSHNSLISNKKNKSYFSLWLTIMLGLIFTFFQLIEYNESMFCLSDSIYGSLFFLTTGFHGLHVLLGSLFLLITMKRMKNNHMSVIHHFGFEAAAWYWHFVDVIWIIVFTMIYWWNY